MEKITNHPKFRLTKAYLKALAHDEAEQGYSMAAFHHKRLEERFDTETADELIAYYRDEQLRHVI